MITEDLTIFLEDFGEDFSHQDIGSFKAIFKDKHASHDYEVGLTMYAPEIFVFKDIASQLYEAELVTRESTGVAYAVSDIQPDGTGGYKIRLFEA